MTPIDRRHFLTTTSALALVRVPVPQAPSSAPPAQATTVPPDVTRTLARYVLSAKKEDLPAKVRHEATRTLLNYVGCAVGGSHHETVDIAVSVDCTPKMRRGK